MWKEHLGDWASIALVGCLFTCNTKNLWTITLISNSRGWHVDRCLGRLPFRLNADTLVHSHVHPLFSAKLLQMSSTEYLHFFPTADLQDFALFSPVHDVVQLFLDALWRGLSSHAHRGVCVRWETTHVVVLYPGLGYVFSAAEFWATFTSVCIFTVFF